MGISIKNFAETVLGIDHDTLKKREVFIKFIVTHKGVVFDPQLFVNFEKTFGEGSLYHKDIADANQIDRALVAGGAYAAISHENIRITGKSMDFGGIGGFEKTVKDYFENYFDSRIVL
jgi:hypothetical protein